MKRVAEEHWDDYHLRSVQLGGNKALFDLLKEYDALELDFQKRYKHACVNWYKRMHAARMDQKEFNVPKPPKTWDERKEMTKGQLKRAGTIVGQKSELLVADVGQGTVKVGAKLVEGAKNLKEKH